MKGQDTLFSSASVEQYTPQNVITAVVAALGRIDLDPCAPDLPDDRQPVPAGSYFTERTNGLAQPWYGRIYMNPPYGRTVGAWVLKLLNEYSDRHVLQAIMLLPARTDTAWFHMITEDRLPFCLVRGRLRFSNAENCAPFPSVLVGVGVSLDRFMEAMKPLGDVFIRISG